LKYGYAFGSENPATYKVSAYSLKNGLHVALQHFSNIVNFSSPMMGFFNVYNLTCAVASVNLLTKKPLQEICDVVEYFGGVSGRMEIVNQNPQIVVDFAHTPDGMKEVFISFAGCDIITVFGAGGDRDRTKRPMMGKMATFYSKEVIITADNPRNEDPDNICNDILKGCKDANNYEIELNRKIAIKKAIEKSKKYDHPIILILGKGDEENQIIYDKKFPLNDKKIVEELYQIN
jgi:UDP-N-acetylmuramoyl-L-alanyl-D-glutamate--2,6-diaminopimelate ligase